MFVTHSVRLLSGVNAQVALQGLQVAEAGATGVARVRLLPGMDQNVGPEVGNLKPGHIHTVRLRFVIKKKMSVSTLRHDRLMPCVRYDMFNINQCFPNPKMALCFVHNPKIVYCPRGAKKDEKYSRLEAFFQKITQTDESTIKIAGD